MEWVACGWDTRGWGEEFQFIGKAEHSGRCRKKGEEGRLQVDEKIERRERGKNKQDSSNKRMEGGECARCCSNGAKKVWHERDIHNNLIVEAWPSMRLLVWLKGNDTLTVRKVPAWMMITASRHVKGCIQPTRMRWKHVTENYNDSSIPAQPMNARLKTA